MDNKVLGKGLSALILQAQQKTVTEEIDKEKPAPEALANFIADTEMISHMATKLISNNPFQPRQDYNEESLEELKASIKENGILQPILVRANKGRIEVVAGERRLRAARALGLENVPVVVKKLSDSEVLLIALIENIQRQDLNVIDEARAFDRLATEFQMTHDQIAKSVGKDRATVSNTLRLLKLPETIQQQIVKEQISMGHARALLALDNEAAQLKLAYAIIAQSLSVRSVEGLVQQAVPRKAKLNKNKIKDQDIANLEEELRSILGTKVTVEDKKGKGQLVIEYYSLDDLDRVLNILRKK